MQGINTPIKPRGAVLHCISTNVEPCCDAVLNLDLEVGPEDDACVETRWTIICFECKS
jgi:hypothetical protein